MEVATESSAAKRADIRAETSTRVSVARERPAKPTPERSSTPVLVRTETPTPAAAPAPAQTTTHRVTGSSGPRAKAADRIHVVRPGESLWSIASDFLGDGASVAQVAREVSRLWELNEDRIATGSPDLLYAGTRLRLR